MTIRIGTSGWVYPHWRDIFIYFNNDVGGYALENAKTLRRLLAED